MNKTGSGPNDVLEASSPVAHHRGFTTIELAVAMIVSLILAAMAIPQVMNAVYMTRVRSAADQVSALVQQTRTMAEQRNTTISFRTANVGTGSKPGAFISCRITSTTNCPDGATWNSGDPYISYASGFTNSTSSSAPAALTITQLGFTPAASGTVLSFTGLGTPTANVGVAFYLTDGNNHWSAVSVSPMGRSKVWIYSGSWH